MNCCEALPVAASDSFAPHSFNGVATSGCSSETVALSLQDPQALFVFGTFVLSQLNVLLAATRRGFVKSLAYSLGSNLGSNLL